MAGYSEYQDEYCGLSSNKKGGSGGQGDSEGMVMCSKSEDVQPVGGRTMHKYLEEKEKKAAEDAEKAAAAAAENGECGCQCHNAPPFSQDFLNSLEKYQRWREMYMYGPGSYRETGEFAPRQPACSCGKK